MSVVPQLGHNYSSVIVKPSCPNQGYTSHTCTICGDTYKDTYVKANEKHDFQKSNNCAYCKCSITDVAVEVYDVSLTSGVKCYIIHRPEGGYDGYIKGNGGIKNFALDNMYASYLGYRFVDIYIENGITSIGDLAFRLQKNLKSVTFEEGSQLKSIGEGAFSGCERLASITIPRGVTSIGQGAFSGCDSLTSITFEDPAVWCCDDKWGNTWGYNLTMTDPSKNATYLKDT
ncbi:MAG: leucine-rich repeat domain-containing protein [Clostridia bacterium]|nr:leucine-rich repeat domain-containing protein [Clostridia bacterium]